MVIRLKNRRQAGQQLAQALARYASQENLLVLGLPRGGIPVAREVAQALHAPLDVFVVRKLGVPGEEELAMGAIATGGATVLNDEVVDALALSSEAIERVKTSEEHELARRESLYRQGLPPDEVQGRLVILVDDGVATGSTRLAAVKALRPRHPERIVVAVPVAPRETCRKLAAVADDFTCLYTPEPFFGVGSWYDDFSQTTDAEVISILSEMKSLRRAVGGATPSGDVIGMESRA